MAVVTSYRNRQQTVLQTMRTVNKRSFPRVALEEGDGNRCPAVTVNKPCFRRGGPSTNRLFGRRRRQQTAFSVP